MNRCDVVISGDSLGMHMAIALSKHVVAWFGPTSPQEIDLYDRGVKLLADRLCTLLEADTVSGLILAGKGCRQLDSPGGIGLFGESPRWCTHQRSARSAMGATPVRNLKVVSSVSGSKISVSDFFTLIDWVLFGLLLVIVGKVTHGRKPVGNESGLIGADFALCLCCFCSDFFFRWPFDSVLDLSFARFGLQLSESLGHAFHFNFMNIFRVHHAFNADVDDQVTSEN